MLELNYDTEVKKHNNMLVDKLRDFGSENLQFWVPEDNIIKSLMSMIYSLSENNIKDFKISIDLNTIKPIKPEQVVDSLKKFSICNFEINQKNILLKVSNVNEKNFYTINKEILESSNKNKINNQKTIHHSSFSFKKIDNNTIKKIKELYLLNLETLKDPNIENLNENENLINIKKIKINNTYFYLKLNEEKVVNIFCDKNSSKHEKKLISFFKEVNIGTPLFEVCEHGLIKLETNIRPKNLRDYVNGSISQLFVRKIFPEIQNSLFVIWKEFNILQNSKLKKNLYDLKISDKWSKLSIDEKIKKINQTIDKFNLNQHDNKILFSELEDGFKVTVDIKSSVDAYSKSSRLLNFEKYIKENIDKRLEVFYKELKDENKLRMKNSPI